MPPMMPRASAPWTLPPVKRTALAPRVSDAFAMLASIAAAFVAMGQTIGDTHTARKVEAYRTAVTESREDFKARDENPIPRLAAYKTVRPAYKVSAQCSQTRVHFSRG